MCIRDRNTFARHTNVDTQARIIAYDIRELGEQLMPLGMLVTLDAIYNLSLIHISAFAASDPLVVVENLSTFIFSLIRAVGLILLGWGIVQVGLSLQSHDPSQRSQGFLTLAGGLVITFAKEILDLITA